MNLLQKIKYLKEIQNKEELNDLTAKLPKNEEVCKEILKMLDNTSVAVEKNQVEDSTTSLYLVLNNKILIGNMKQSFVRIQTIATPSKTEKHCYFISFWQMLSNSILSSVCSFAFC